MKLILFDIDGTLLVSQGAGRATLGAAMEAVYGTSGPIETFPFSGGVDNEIVAGLLTAVNYPQDQIEPQLAKLYEVMAQKATEIFPTKPFNKCEGVEELLQELNQRDDVLLGIVTGNNHLTAPMKLEAAGIDPAQFRVGSYGSEASHRDDLPALAMQRAQKLTGLEFNGKNTVVIGDTPADIACARAVNGTAVAVCTGYTSKENLQQHHPDYLLDNLANVSQVISILTQGEEPMTEEQQTTNNDTFDVNGIQISQSEPTTVTFNEVFRWIVWQYPNKAESGLCGAVHPPIPEYGWFPAIIKPREKTILIHGHTDTRYSSPEKAAKSLKK